MNNEIDRVKVHVQVPLSLIKKVERFAKKRGFQTEHALAFALKESDIYQSVITEASKKSYFGNVFATYPMED